TPCTYSSLYCHLHPPALHSFPTRRSSDLAEPNHHQRVQGFISLVTSGHNCCAHPDELAIAQPINIAKNLFFIFVQSKWNTDVKGIEIGEKSGFVSIISAIYFHQRCTISVFPNS